jgi:hypothetical protein
MVSNWQRLALVTAFDRFCQGLFCRICLRVLFATGLYVTGQFVVLQHDIKQCGSLGAVLYGRFGSDNGDITYPSNMPTGSAFSQKC